jgi:radical SAM superfamily enzyme YgiQ (UPF0313 family)
MTGPMTPGTLRAPGAVLLLSCYELGRQPLGLAWPRAFLRDAGYDAETLDLAVEPYDAAKVARARFVGIAAPMHTALRLGVRAAERVRRANPDCFICFYGLYAFLNAGYLLRTVADAVIAGEFEGPLAGLVAALDRGARDAGGAGDTVPGVVTAATAAGPRRPALGRLRYPVPDRRGLPELRRYARFVGRDGPVLAGAVEATRGCLHRCLHCPIPPVYGGRFFVVPQDVVLADIRRLVAAGAGHITFGDPDFLNGPGHALKLARALHAEFPHVTWDCTAKIAHLLEHRTLVREFGALGCAFIVSAVESLSDVVLAHLEKGHRRADIPVALDIVRDAGIALRPSFVAFTPWTTLADYLDMLDFVAAYDLVDAVDPVQYAIRLLVPPGSALLARPAIRPYLEDLDPAAFSYRWRHPDPRMDRLHEAVSALVEADARAGVDPRDTFARVRATAEAVQSGGRREPAPMPRGARRARARSPRLTEPWFC